MFMSKFYIYYSKCKEIVLECLTPLRLFLKQLQYPELRAHLEMLMDHNEDVQDIEVI